LNETYSCGSESNQRDRELMLTRCIWNAGLELVKVLITEGRWFRKKAALRVSTIAAFK
jgi:hypothetical protein